MKKIYSFLLVLCTGIFAASSTVDEILQKMPPQSPAERNELASALYQLGEADILDICSKIVPAHPENAAATFAVSSLCDWAGQGGMDKERKQVSAILLKAIGSTQKVTCKAFFIEQLALVGSKRNVAALESFLSDADLCDPASRTMIVLDPGKAEKLLIKNLSGAGDVQKISIINALGEIGSKKSAAYLLPLLETDHENLRDVVLFALARSGSEKAASALKQNISISEGVDQQKAYSFYFDFIEKQPAKKAAIMYRDLLAENPDAHIVNRAISGLYKIEKSALTDIVDALQKNDKQVLACALRLTNGEGEAISKIWVGFAKTASPAKRALVAAAFANRRDDTAKAFVKSSLMDLNQDVRCAAIPAFAEQNEADAFDALFTILKSAREPEVHIAMQALLTYASTKDVLDKLQSRLPELPPVSQAAVVSSFAARKDFTQKNTIFALAESEVAPVRLASMNALIAMVDGDDLDRLIKLFQSAQDVSELLPIQDAIVGAANASEPAKASTLIAAFEQAQGQRKSSLLWILSRLNNADALKIVINQASGKSTMRQEALQMFGSGPSVMAIPSLIELVKSLQDENAKKMAKQKVIRLIRDGHGIAAQDRIDFCETLMDLTESRQDKIKILGIAPRARTIESLKFVDSYLENAGLQREAAKAAISIALPQDDNSGLSGDKVVRILTRAVAIPGEEESVANAKAYLQKLRNNGAKETCINTPPPGFVRLFNGYDLAGWQGLAGKGGNPYERAKLSPEQLKTEQARADSLMRAHWRVENGVLVFDGHGSHLCTVKKYHSFEMLVDWKIAPKGDSGIYLRGTPQVQIWDPAQWPEGSGGLYNNQKGASKPLVCADNPIGEWNTFRIKMVGDRVTVHLNDKLVVDDVVLENYWDRSQPIFPFEQIELQSHGSTLYFKNVFIREIFTKKDGWTSLFDGKTLNGWTGAVDGYHVQNGAIVCKPGSGGNLLTEHEYSDFEYTFEFKLTPGANSGLGIRAPLQGDAAYKGMELQILDNSAQRYAKLKPYQYHASIYGVVPAKRGFLKTVGEWNSQHVTVKGNRVKVELNGVTIVDADIQEASANGTLDGREHPGLQRSSGHIGFLGHDAHVEFRNIYVKTLK